MAAAESKAEMPWNVLVVKDEEAQRRILADFLKGQGYPVQTATNGKEGLAKFEQDHFDFVIADYKMPGMDGLTLLREIRGLNPEARVGRPRSRLGRRLRGSGAGAILPATHLRERNRKGGRDPWASSTKSSRSSSGRTTPIATSTTSIRRPRSG